MECAPGNGLFRLAICLCWLNIASGLVYDWTKAKIDYPSKDMFLHVVPLQVTQNRFVVTQCAMDCLKDNRCKSYNFLSDPAVCVLNDKSHVDVPTSSLRKNTTSEYYEREAFSIDPLALGLCTGVTCENGGQCIETTDSQGADIFHCVCVQGWAGDHCQTQVPWPYWGAWTNWGACSVTCGLGWRLRTRKCMDGQTQKVTDSLRCPGKDTDVEECDDQECPRWNHWGNWGVCSTETTCGKGLRTRTRTCSNGGTPGVDRFCMGPLNQTGYCQGIDCKAPVRLQDGPTFGEGRVELFNDLTESWGSICADKWDLNAANTACRQMGFSAASEVVTDGRYGMGTGTITLSDVSCPTTGRKIQGCRHSVWSATTECAGGSAAGVKCKVDGDWNMWTSWGTCSVTCETGIETRTRMCDLPPTLHGGEPCAGPGIEQRACTQPPCPGSGTWGNWGPWEACDVSCGDGSHRRYRICVDTVSCSGATEETQACSTNVPCPVNGLWQQWSAWTQCTVTCGGGWRSRERNCTDPRHGGEECFGEAGAVTDCNTQPCPVDGYWLEWSDWSECTVSCGSGSQTRMRECNPAKHGGINCTGVSQDTVSCNTHPCPVDGFWLEWSDWLVCTVPCGSGSQGRMRECNPGKYGGANCSGPSNETRECNTHPCPVDGYWWQWSDWSPCTLPCGVGSQERTRDCVPGRHGGANCSGDSLESQECNTHPCPVDGFWLEWSDWSMCTEACGNGSQVRMRVCNPGKHGGANCSGSFNETRECNTHPCPVDGFWLSWCDWSVCTTSCGTGSQVRMRNCNLGKHGGANCSGSSSESQQCNTHSCPVDGFWLEWSDWSMCSVSCGNGSQVRMRGCNPGKHGGANCSGSSRETQACNTHPCPADGFWLVWSDWSLCTVSCGNGSQLRMRDCNLGKHGGANCSGAFSETQECNTQPCPVDGFWLPWSDWSDCTVSCGNGSRTRMRECFPSKHGGANCSGPTLETQECNTHHCPVNGVWSPWSNWSVCSVTCGGGNQERGRVCEGQRYGGDPCHGNGTENQGCNLHPCPVDGVFQEWSIWGDCSVSCGGGTKIRTRKCVQPKFGGKECEGSAEEESTCNPHPCQVDGIWEDWSVWNTCSLTCGGGTRKRERVCTGTAHGGKECEGSDWEVEECSTNPCPVDGMFQDWSVWGDCSVTCGGGIKTRTRDCTPPQFGGTDCVGESEEEDTCNTQPCPVDGVWEDWSVWNTCSVTCGGGTHKRERVCTGTAHGGKECEGSDWEVEECSTNPCPVDGEFTPWGDWGECSVTCGGGTRTRRRDCILPQYGGEPCNGDRFQIEDCGTENCPVDGRWNVWGKWSPCSETCGVGTQQRERTCDGPYHGGNPCQGLAEEDRECQQPPCLIPGDWEPWSDWSSCSVTCGGGIRRRSRQCDMTSHGDLTAPCAGDPEEDEECHIFPCQPYARSCSGLRTLGLTESAEADIDPDGPSGETPVRVFCDMEAQGGVGVTIIGHDQEEEIEVNGYEGAGEYDTGELVYNATWEQVLALVDLSASCRQFVSWKCKAALMHNRRGSQLDDQTKDYILTTFWRNRTGGAADYWGGAPPDSGSCDCGVTKTCADPKATCNCDSNDAVWREDAGYINVKNDLPVTSFAAGDTGNLDEAGSVVIGPLQCFRELILQ